MLHVNRHRYFSAIGSDSNEIKRVAPPYVNVWCKLVQSSMGFCSLAVYSSVVDLLDFRVVELAHMAGLYKSKLFSRPSEIR